MLWCSLMMNNYLVEGTDEKEIHNPAIGRRTVESNGPGSQRQSGGLPLHSRANTVVHV